MASTLTSSSASHVQKSFKYDVFLSFRGVDTRKTFVDHLYHALHQKGIITYKDDERIEKGERISDQLIRSIEESRIYIIVFSKNYASSSWCLDELAKIMECQKTKEHTAYPVFYDVEPTEVRHQSGAVGKAFAKHEKGSWRCVLAVYRFIYYCIILVQPSFFFNVPFTRPVDPETENDVGRWRNALKEAADLAGMELKNNFNGHEAKFIQQIVQEISPKLHFVNLSLDKKLVGMKARVKSVIASLEISFDDVRMIGIKGMGGGGKTTLARAVFDHISINFEGKSFVENVREISKSSSTGLKKLQNQVLKDVLNDQSIMVTSVSDGKIMMEKMMCSRKVLVVLDDVDDIEQLEALAGELTWFKPGSRIIITTRDQQVLVAHGVNFIHDVILLSYEEAICLFNRYAFKKEIPNQGYEDLSRKVVNYAAGLPLTIKVLGSHLCGRSESEWQDAIDRLRTIPLDKTLKRLEISYNGLENDQKEIFLDVVCILKGEKKVDAIRILECCGFNAQIGLSVLEQKSLITISDYDDLSFHDHIEEMGWNIVRRMHPDNPSMHNRLWIKEEIEEILVNELGTEETKCMKLEFTDVGSTKIMKGLRKMHGLRLLYVNNVSNEWMVDEVGKYLPNALRSLCWHQYPYRSLPKTFRANKLVNLEMKGSNISILWKVGEIKVLDKLRYLDLRGSKLRTFDVGTPHLRKLNLQHCYDFIELHMPVTCAELKHLNLSGSKVSCLNLGMTPHLEELYLKGCQYFVELHMPSECPNLKLLNLSGSKVSKFNLMMTPHLEVLNLKECYDLVELYIPTICPKLKELNLSGSKVSNLNLRMTPHLEELNLKECNAFVVLHMPIECPNLKYLNLSGSKLGNLNLGMTPFLEQLTLEGCNDFVELHMPFECPNLKNLNLSGSKVRSLNLGMTPHLKELNLRGCYCLQETLTPRGCLKYLCYLNLNECLRFANFLVDKRNKLPSFNSVETISTLQHLREVRLASNIPQPLSENMCGLELTAQSLHICPLHPKSKWPKFQFRCYYDERLPSPSGNLEKLISFGPCACTNLESFTANICGLQALGKLILRGSIPEVPKDLYRLECLEELTLCMDEIKYLPDSICMLKHLKSLKLGYCLLLEQLPNDLGILECLEALDLRGCRSLRAIPKSICMMKSLTFLSLSYCILIDKLPEEFGRLECLKRLDIERAGIRCLPQSIYQLKGLHIYGARGQLQSYGFIFLKKILRDLYCVEL